MRKDMANNEQLGAKKSENVQETENFGTRFINFFAKYQNVIYGVIIAILVVIAAIMALNKFYFTPKNEKASAAMLAPMQYYMAGDSTSLKLALDGDDDNDGFLTIILKCLFQFLSAKIHIFFKITTPPQSFRLWG